MVEKRFWIISERIDCDKLDQVEQLVGDVFVCDDGCM